MGILRFACEMVSLYAAAATVKRLAEIFVDQKVVIATR